MTDCDCDNNLKFIIINEHNEENQFIITNEHNKEQDNKNLNQSDLIKAIEKSHEEESIIIIEGPWSWRKIKKKEPFDLKYWNQQTNQIKENVNVRKENINYKQITEMLNNHNNTILTSKNQYFLNEKWSKGNVDSKLFVKKTLQNFQSQSNREFMTAESFNIAMLRNKIYHKFPEKYGITQLLSQYGPNDIDDDTLYGIINNKINVSCTFSIEGWRKVIGSLTRLSFLTNGYKLYFILEKISIIHKFDEYFKVQTKKVCIFYSE